METVSALLDGELDQDEASRLIVDLKSREDLRDAWATYHLIGDALRGHRCPDCGLAASVAEKLGSEPTVLAPRMPSQSFGKRWALPSLAAAAAVATVTWMSLQSQPSPSYAPPIAAQSTTHLLLPVAATRPQPPMADVTDAVPLAQAVYAPPSIELSAREFQAYLMAHQEFSPSTTIQGVAPYVRTVSSNGAER